MRDIRAAFDYTIVMRLIETTTELAAICDRLANERFVAVDTEFMREQTFWPQLCLVQLAGPSPNQEFLIDPLAGGIDLAPLVSLMTDRPPVKVFHAARQDIEIVHIMSGRVPAPLFDTQVAAMVCGFGESISYVNLVKRVLGQDLDKSSRFTDWSRRPLSQKQLVYALGDVTHLRDVYVQLDEKLKSTGRHAWLAEEMAALGDPETYVLRPEDAWKRLKLKVRNRRSLAVLIELAAWRDGLAQSLNVPRNRVLRDEALYDVANQAPTDVAALSGLRTLSDGFARSQRAKEIIEVVKRGLARDLKTVPPIPGGPALSADANALVDLLRVLLKAAAARHSVAPRLIADADELERLATEDEPDIAVLKGWRRELFGADALRLKRGEVAIVVRKGEVVTVDAPKA
ncbi:MAG TPA: ribonuclease D [Hyphomicrobiaceae bacterium]|nr:ribonuclease D [Hyphomicrobiaceae bacterium]